MKKMMKKMMSGGMKPKSKMGFKEDAGQKFLMKMTKGGMMDMSEMGNMMQAGYGKQVPKMGMAKKGREYPKRGQRAAKHMKK
tara:strand:- start:672 stop:917 length:246 start_codon:yes stop_codon:yes gene_type:complete